MAGLVTGSSRDFAGDGAGRHQLAHRTDLLGGWRDARCSSRLRERWHCAGKQRLALRSVLHRSSACRANPGHHEPGKTPRSFPAGLFQRSTSGALGRATTGARPTNQPVGLRARTIRAQLAIGQGISQGHRVRGVLIPSYPIHFLCAAHPMCWRERNHEHI